MATNSTRPNPGMLAFGIFMILVYVAMGVLMFTDFFAAVITWKWARIVLGVGFCVVGVFRGYSIIKKHSY